MSERHASRDMRDRIQDLLQKAADLTLYFWNKVNNAFTDKIREQVHARNTLQTHLAKVRFTPRHYITCIGRYTCIHTLVIRELLFAKL